jgi:hypothetical protein
MRKLAASVLVLGACVTEPVIDEPVIDEPVIDEPVIDEPTLTNVPRIGTNSLSPTQLASTALTTDVLSSANAAAMGQTAHARKVLAYAVSCALSDTQSVSFVLSGTTYNFYGAMGLVPGWTSNDLTASEAGWVSACILARVNVSSSLLYISARGDQGGLGTTSGELTGYQVEEGAFWGNAFVDLGSLAMYSCNGVDQAADDTYGDLPLRECAEWDGVTASNLSPCGMSYAGLCSSACTTATAPYEGCSFLGGTAVNEVVTTFLYGTPP